MSTDSIGGKPRFGVGMVGYAFMGAAHSQAWRTAGRFFDLPYAVDMTVLGGRNADAARAAAARLGWAGVETDWRRLIEREDVDLVDVCTPGRHPRRDRDRGARERASTCCARSRSRTPSRRPRR